MPPVAIRLEPAELAVGAVALVANLAQRSLPTGVRVSANLAAAASVTAIARTVGVGWSELGLDPAQARRGLRCGIAAAAAITLTVGIVGRFPEIRSRFVDERIMKHSRRRATYELAIRIPVETAFAEEVVFRSALLGIALRHRSPSAAVAMSSALFGLWHVVPAWTGMAGSPIGTTAGAGRAGQLGMVAGVVAATAAAGTGLATLRLRSGTVLAPMLAHAALNMTSFAISRSASRDVRRVDPVFETVRG